VGQLGFAASQCFEEETMGNVVIRERRGGYRSLFWPVVLIGIGAIWLLLNLQILTAQNLIVAVRLWPLLLIVVGIDLLFGRTSAVLGALIGIGFVVVFVLLMLLGPSIGLGYDLKEYTLNDTVAAEGVNSAHVVLQANTANIWVKPLADSNKLIRYDITSFGQVDVNNTGSAQKEISLKQPNNEGINGAYGWIISAFSNNSDKYRWNIGVSPSIPLSLDVTSGTGGANLDLSGVKLTNLKVNVGTGGIDLNLPATDSRYTVNLDTGTGGGKVVIAENADVDMQVNSGTGGFTIDVPDNAAVHVEGKTGVGGITVPGSLHRLGGENNGNVVGENGVWETDGYANADHKITIHFSGGTGGLTVK
jgi:hypothetical protein